MHVVFQQLLVCGVVVCTETKQSASWFVLEIKMASSREDVNSIKAKVGDWLDSLTLPHGIDYDWTATPCRDGCQRGV